jgi:hypothetical protein
MLGRRRIVKMAAAMYGVCEFCTGYSYSSDIEDGHAQKTRRNESDQIRLAQTSCAMVEANHFCNPQFG